MERKRLNEKAFDINNKPIVEIKKKYFRPAEVDRLVGNFKKAKKILKWQPKHDLNSLIDDMIRYEIKLIKNDK